MSRLNSLSDCLSSISAELRDHARAAVPLPPERTRAIAVAVDAAAIVVSDGALDEFARIAIDRDRDRGAAEKQAGLYLEALRGRHPFAVAVSRWPGGLTLFALGVLTGMLIADLWGVLP